MFGPLVVFAQPGEQGERIRTVTFIGRRSAYLEI